MYKKVKYNKTKLAINESREGETIETKIVRIVENNEPITDGAPLVYTERKDGVQAGYNIRTDRFEVAVDAMDSVTKSNIAKRDNLPKMEVVKEVNKEVGEAQTVRGTEINNNKRYARTLI